MMLAACGGADDPKTCQRIDPFSYDASQCGDKVLEGFHKIGSPDDLKKLAGFTHLDGYLVIEDTDAVCSLAGLEQLRCISGDLTIRNASGLERLDGLAALRHVKGNLRIGDLDAGNPKLSDISGLSNLVTVGGQLWIEGNQRLRSLDGLSALTTVGGFLGIYGNPALTSTAALSALRSVGQGINIASNKSLPTCAAVEVKDRLGDQSPCLPTCIRDNLADACPHEADGCWYRGE
jgi:hypothetical protein